MPSPPVQFVHHPANPIVLTSLQFHFRRHMHLLRRAWSSLQANGLGTTWRRIRLRPTAGPTAAASRQAPASPMESPGTPWLLVVDVSVPEPDKDSGSLRLSNLMQTLRQAGYRLAFIPDDGHTNGAGADVLRALDIHVPRLAGARGIPSWLHRHQRDLTAAILCRHHTAGHWLPLIRSLAPHARVVFDTVDLHFLREQREADLQAGHGLRRSTTATRQRELGLVTQADTTWVVSPIERDLLLQACPGADVRVLSNIIDVDTPGQPFGERHDLLFVGGLRHPPNRDAVAWLTQDIFPRIRRALPDVRLHLVGALGIEPAPEVDPDSGIHVHGHVPDIDPFLDGCRIALAPLRFGAGVKGKVNLSMAHGQPVVATPCAIEGMHLQPALDVLAAADADAFASEVVRLYRDGTLWQQLSDRGRANVRDHFSPQIALGVAKATLGNP